MKDGVKTKEQLITELAEMRRRIAELKAAETERVRAEEALRASEARFRELADLLPQTVFETDERGNITFANQSAFDHFGYTKDEFDMGLAAPQMISLEDRDRAKRNLGRVMRGEKLGGVEYTARRKDGSTFPIIVYSSPIAYENKTVGLRGIITDITEHKQTEEALRESEERYRTVADFTHDWEYWIDPDGSFVYVSPSCERITGYRADAFIQNPDFLRVVIHPDDWGTFVNHQHEVLETGEVLPIDFRIITRSGDERWIGHVCQPIYSSDGRYLGQRSSNRDITRHKQAEQALRESEDRLRQVVENMPVMMDAFDADGNILVWNQECELVTGFSADEIIGNPRVPELLYPDAAYREQMLTEWNERGDDHRDWEWKMTCRDGSVKTVTWSNISTRFPIPGWATWGIGVDITERKRAEEALRQYAAELKARNEELDAFAHTVAHDLKGPLGHMVGFAQLLEDSHATLADEDQCDILRVIAQSGRKMCNIIDELLLLSALRGVEVEMVPLDMASIVDGARQRLAYMIEEYQAEIVLPETWPVPLGYSPWIEEVWANYLSNALKYGGQPPRVELGATVQADGMVRFWIRDNGLGLTPEEHARLFTPFTRLKQVQVKGHGLGLSIVRRIVERLSGQVDVESKVGQGSVFAFTLPGVQAEGDATSPR